MTYRTDTIATALWSIADALPEAVSAEDFDAYYDLLLGLVALLHGGTERQRQIEQEIQRDMQRILSR